MCARSCGLAAVCDCVYDSDGRCARVCVWFQLFVCAIACPFAWLLRVVHGCLCVARSRSPTRTWALTPYFPRTHACAHTLLFALACVNARARTCVSERVLYVCAIVQLCDCVHVLVVARVIVIANVCLFMHAWLCAFVSVCVLVCLFVCSSLLADIISVRVCVWLCLCAYCIWLCVCVFWFLCACVCVCLAVFMCLCVVVFCATVCVIVHVYVLSYERVCPSVLCHMHVI